MRNVFLLLGLILSLGSCIEIIDDLTIKNDGSGVIKYTLNFSSNKIKINSILALDSLDGEKVPKIPEIREKLDAFRDALKAKEGITNVKVDANFEQFIFKFQVDFNSLQALHNAIKEVIKAQTKEKNWEGIDQEWISWDGTKLMRLIPEFTLNKADKIKDEDLLNTKNGTYTSISRFERAIEKSENTKAIISPNKLNIMLRTDVYSLIQNPKLLQNTITLIPLKN
jgi:hypothetical protein